MVIGDYTCVGLFTFLPEPCQYINNETLKMEPDCYFWRCSVNYESDLTMVQAATIIIVVYFNFYRQPTLLHCRMTLKSKLSMLTTPVVMQIMT